MNYRYTLLPYKGPSSRVTCPLCGAKREFAPYIDNETGELLPDHVGRCNRELHCGYHYTAKQYFSDKGSFIPAIEYHKPKEIEKPISYHPLEHVERSMQGYNRNNFYLILLRLFGEAVAMDLIKKYMIGSSKHWPGANIFWQIDGKEKVRTGKIMLYDAITAKRVREPKDYITWVHRVLKLEDFNHKQCFFGEHLLAEHPKETVCIVESEKTAVICSVYFPEIIWIATGGKNGCRWTEREVIKALAGRTVILYPDADAFEVWTEKAKQVSKLVKCDLSVSDFLEKNLNQDMKKKGMDLADLLLKTCETTGNALTHPGYPVIWDYNIQKKWCNGVALVQ